MTKNRITEMTILISGPKKCGKSRLLNRLTKQIKKYGYKVLPSGEHGITLIKK